MNNEQEQNNFSQTNQDMIFNGFSDQVRDEIKEQSPVMESVPVEEVSAPVMESVPVEEVSAPVMESVPVEGVSAPVMESVPVEGVSAPVMESVPVEEVSAPVMESVPVEQIEETPIQTAEDIESLNRKVIENPNAKVSLNRGDEVKEEAKENEDNSPIKILDNKSLIFILIFGVLLLAFILLLPYLP